MRAFFLIFFAIFGLINFYIFIRGLQSIPEGSGLRDAYVIIFWIIACSFIGGRLFEYWLPSAIANLFIWMGSFWIAAMVYLLIAVISLDLLRLINHFLPIFPPTITENYPQAKYFASVVVMGCVGILLLAGHVNALLPRVKTLNLSIEKKAGGLQEIDIVAVSDIHLGEIVGRARIEGIVDKINRLNPDLVLMPGDILDEDLSPAGKQSIGEPLRNIRARFGVYASPGNHEYISGISKASSYLAKHEIVLLRDKSVKIADSLIIVGRDYPSFGGRDPQRKDLAELMMDLDKTCPVILMDHAPSAFREAAAQGVDLQISGHTHNGQLWPVNYIVGAIYEVAWGYKKIDNTHLYVSNGVGTWAPPVRMGNRPEIVHIHLKFQGS